MKQLSIMFIPKITHRKYVFLVWIRFDLSTIMCLVSLTWFLQITLVQRLPTSTIGYTVKITSPRSRLLRQNAIAWAICSWSWTTQRLSRHLFHCSYMCYFWYLIRLMIRTWYLKIETNSIPRLGPYLLRNNPLPSLNNYCCINSHWHDTRTRQVPGLVTVMQRLIGHG